MSDVQQATEAHAELAVQGLSASQLAVAGVLSALAAVLVMIVVYYFVLRAFYGKR